MPADIRPPPGVSLLHYPDAFNPEMAFQVRERDIATLEEMKNIAVYVEVNLLKREEKFKAEEELIQFDSLPLCFNSSQILKGNLGHILVDNHRRNHEMSMEPTLQSSKALHDPIADTLDG